MGGRHELHEINLRDKTMPDFLFVVAPFSGEENAEVYPDHFQASRSVQELAERRIKFRKVVIDPGSRRWRQTEFSTSADPDNERWESLPQTTQTPKPLFVVFPHALGEPALVHDNIEIAAKWACGYEEGSRVVAVNPDTKDASKWKEGHVAGPKPGTNLEQLRSVTFEELRRLADELAADS